METFNDLSVVKTNDNLLINNELFSVQKSGVMLKLNSDFSKRTLPANKKSVHLALISYVPETDVKNYKLDL